MLHEDRTPGIGRWRRTRQGYLGQIYGSCQVLFKVPPFGRKTAALVLEKHIFRFVLGSSKNLLHTQDIFEQDPVKRLDGEARLLQMRDYVSR